MGSTFTQQSKTHHHVSLRIDAPAGRHDGRVLRSRERRENGEDGKRGRWRTGRTRLRGRLRSRLRPVRSLRNCRSTPDASIFYEHDPSLRPPIHEKYPFSRKKKKKKKS